MTVGRRRTRRRPRGRRAARILGGSRVFNTPRAGGGEEAPDPCAGLRVRLAGPPALCWQLRPVSARAAARLGPLLSARPLLETLPDCARRPPAAWPRLLPADSPPTAAGTGCSTLTGWAAGLAALRRAPAQAADWPAACAAVPRATALPTPVRRGPVMDWQQTRAAVPDASIGGPSDRRRGPSGEDAVCTTGREQCATQAGWKRRGGERRGTARPRRVRRGFGRQMSPGRAVLFVTQKRVCLGP